MAKTVGLALGGGGARGWAHVGVIRALEEAQIPIDYIAGTSIGALVGAIYVVGTLERLEAFAEDVALEDLLSLMDVTFPSPGLMDGERIYDFISQYGLDQLIEDTAIPFRCVATNFLLKQEVVLQAGSMVDAVRASISIPGIFTPFQPNNNVYLVDGGVVNPVPVNVAKAMGAEIVIAVNLNHDPNPDEAPANEAVSSATNETGAETASDETESSTDQNQSGVLPNLTNRYQALKNVLQGQADQWIPDPQTGLNIFDVLGNSFNIMEQRVTEVNLRRDQPDILIKPDLMKFGIFDFHQSQPMIERGYQAAQAALPQIKQTLADSA